MNIDDCGDIFGGWRNNMNILTKRVFSSCQLIFVNSMENN